MINCLFWIVREPHTTTDPVFWALVNECGKSRLRGAVVKDICVWIRVAKLVIHFGKKAHLEIGIISWFQKPGAAFSHRMDTLHSLLWWWSHYFIIYFYYYCRGADSFYELILGNFVSRLPTHTEQSRAILQTRAKGLSLRLWEEMYGWALHICMYTPLLPHASSCFSFSGSKLVYSCSQLENYNLTWYFSNFIEIQL